MSFSPMIYIKTFFVLATNSVIGLKNRNLWAKELAIKTYGTKNTKNVLGTHSIGLKLTG